MAKRKKDEFNNVNNDPGLAGIKALMAHAMKTSTSQVCLAADLADRVWGIPCDHISYRWLCDNTCYQMSRIIGVAGMKESCKSAFAMTLAKVWMNLGGACIYIDTENKKSPALYRAIVGADNTYRTLDYVSFTTEEWQEQILGALKFSSENPEMENTPIMFIVDSLGGVDTKETDARIEKEGGINPRNTGGMIKCKSHNEFFRHVNKHLYMKPYALVYINHLSDDPNSPIQGAKRKPGGTGQDYHAVLDLWFSVVKSTPVYKATRGFTEKILKITVNKNSMGASKRNIEIPYRWKGDEETNQISDCWFDWDAATAMLLTDDSPTGVKNRLRDIINVTVNSNKYSCKELGIVAVTDSEMGESIRNNVDLRERISDALGINRMKIYPKLKIEDKSIYEESRYSKVAVGQIANLSEQE
jgi:RecA/RadA recombinase